MMECSSITSISSYLSYLVCSLDCSFLPCCRCCYYCCSYYQLLLLLLLPIGGPNLVLLLFGWWPNPLLFEDDIEDEQEILVKLLHHGGSLTFFAFELELLHHELSKVAYEFYQTEVDSALFIGYSVITRPALPPIKFFIIILWRSSAHNGKLHAF